MKIKKALNPLFSYYPLLVILLIVIQYNACSTQITDPLQALETQGPFPLQTYEGLDAEDILPPGLNLLTLKGGEALQPGIPRSIQWKLVSEDPQDVGLYLTKISYSDNEGSSWTPVPGCEKVPNVDNEVASCSWLVPESFEGAQYQIKVESLGTSGTTKSVIGKSFIFDKTPPVLANNTLTVNHSKDTTSPIRRSYMSLQINADDNLSSVSDICIKTSLIDDFKQPLKPDNCWQPLTSFGEKPNQSVQIFEAPAFLGFFVPGDFYIAVWVRDEAGNATSLVNSANQGQSPGKIGQDLLKLNYQPAKPPVVRDVHVSNSENAQVPYAQSDLNFSNNQTAYIKWNAYDKANRGLDMTKGITIDYTTDEVNFIPLAKGLKNGSNFCVVPEGYTGCYNVPGTDLPTSYFRIRVRVQNLDGMIASSTSSGLNMGNFKFLAGNTDVGLNGSAEKALLFHNPEGASGSFVVTNKGRIYFNDSLSGVMVIDPSDGAATSFLKLNAAVASSGDGGPVNSATAKSILRINLDYQDRLLIFENDRIRRVELDGTIHTLIGGGTGAEAIEFGSPEVTVKNKLMALAKNITFQLKIKSRTVDILFTPLPNGDLYFECDSNKPSLNAWHFCVYKAMNDKVYQVPFTGVGARVGKSIVPTYDLSSSNLLVDNVSWSPAIGISFNPQTSYVEALTTRLCERIPGDCNYIGVNFNPRSGVANGNGIHYPIIGRHYDEPYLTSRKGELFGIYKNADTSSGLWKFDVSTQSWSPVVGGGSLGQCPDGTDALACHVDIVDAYVTADNTIYFLDRGKLRVIDRANQVQTLFGESKSIGDGDNALSARMDSVLYMGNWKKTGEVQDRIIFSDFTEAKIRELNLNDGQVEHLAGNGTNSNPDINADPTQTGFNPHLWGIYSVGLGVDPQNGDVYGPFKTIVRLDRSTGRLSTIFGTGSNVFLSHDCDGKTGNLCKVPQLTTMITGRISSKNKTHFITQSSQTSNNNWMNPFIKLVGSVDGFVQNIAGFVDNLRAPNILPNSGFSDFTNSNAFPLHPYNLISNTSLSLSDTQKRLFLGKYEDRRLVAIPIDFKANALDLLEKVGTPRTLINLTGTRRVASFTLRRVEAANMEKYQVFYCDSVSQTLYQQTVERLFNADTDFTVSSGGEEQPLPLPASITCSGKTMLMNSESTKLYFIFTQNHATGIGEYLLN